jgi:hypothetical protein
MSALRLAIILIHNNTTVRNNQSYLQIRLLKEALGDRHEATVFEISYQPTSINITKQDFLRRQDLLLDLHKSWDAYRSLTHSIYTQLPANCTNITKACIEIVLTDKHLRAWDRFIDGDYDWNLVMEDDIIFTMETVPSVCKIIDGLDPKDTHLEYFDLGGGFPLHALNVSDLISLQDRGTVKFKRPVTNTLCCYLMNRALGTELKRIITARPQYRLLPADWLLNQCFIDLVKAKVHISCTHFFPSIMIHGSMSGFYNSTIQTK